MHRRVFFRSIVALPLLALPRRHARAAPHPDWARVYPLTARAAAVKREAMDDAPLYTDSTANTPAALAVLSDGETTTGGIVYQG